MVFLVGFMRSGHWSVDVDLELLELQGDEIEGCDNNGIGGLDPLQSEDAELEFV
jgi:hypothetical protein